MNREEVKEKVRNRRIKKALKCYRLRPLKNFGMWLTGVLTSFAIIIGGIFVGVKIVPIKSYVGEETNQYVSDKIANKSILDALLDVKEYELTDVPAAAELVLGLVDELGLGAYIELDEEKVKALQLTYDDPNKTFMSEFQACIKVVATMDTVGLTEMIGDLAKLSAFSEWEEVKDTDISLDANGNIAKDGEGNLLNNPALYYYVPENNGAVAPFAMGEPDPADDASYKRAFDDEGNKLYHDGATLHYAKLSAVTIVEALDLIDESFGRLELNEILNVGGADVKEGDMLYDLLADKTISDAGSIGPDSIYIMTLLGGEEDADIYKILSSALDGKPAGDITVADLSSEEFNVMSVELSTFLGEYNEENIIHKILQQATGVEYGKVTLEHLSGDLNVDNVPLTTILGEIDEGDGEGTNIYDILIDAINDPEVTEAKDITISHLTGTLAFDNINISTVLGEYNDENVLQKVLCDVTGKEYGDIKISSLSGELNLNDVSLTNVLGEEDENNKDLYDMLIKCVDSEDVTEAKDLKVSHLSGELKFGKVGLVTVLGEYGSSNSQIYDVLMQATGEDDINDLTVDSLSNSSFVMGNISLTTVLDYEDNEDVFKIIWQAVGNDTNDLTAQTAKTITIDSLSGENFKVDRVNLSSVITINSTDAIAKILDEAFDVYDEGGNLVTDVSYDKVKVGQISGLKVDNVRLTSVLTNIDDKLESILCDALEKDDINQVKVSDLNGFNIDEATLESAFPTLDVKFQDVLVSALNETKGYTAYDQIKIGDLQSISVDNAKLETILPEINASFESILLDLTGAEEYSDIKISQLSGIEVNDASLTCVIEYNASNQSLYEILWEATNQTGELDEDSASNIKISSLGNGAFSIDNVSLETALKLEDDSELAKILKEAFGKYDEDGNFVSGIKYEDLKVSHMKEFKIDNVKLSTFMDPTGNVIMDKLIEKDVTVASIGEEINKLTLYEVYGEGCFKAEEVAGSPLYYEDASNHTYYLADYAPAEIKVEANKRWLCENDGIWLMFCFDSGEFITEGENKGRPASYKATTDTLKALQSHEDGGIASISAKFENATIRQLIDAGIINDMHDGLYTMTLHEAIELLSAMSEAGLLSTT